MKKSFWTLTTESTKHWIWLWDICWALSVFNTCIKAKFDVGYSFERYDKDSSFWFDIRFWPIIDCRKPNIEFKFDVLYFQWYVPMTSVSARNLKTREANLKAVGWFGQLLSLPKCLKPDFLSEARSAFPNLTCQIQNERFRRNGLSIEMPDDSPSRKGQSSAKGTFRSSVLRTWLIQAMLSQANKN